MMMILNNQLLEKLNSKLLELMNEEMRVVNSIEINSYYLPF